ncbi:IGF-like family receptor 1 isoform 6-T7 [Sarcophilus harrisii]
MSELGEGWGGGCFSPKTLLPPEFPRPRSTGGFFEEGLSELQEKRGEMQETNACDNGGHLVGDVCLRVFGAARSWGPCPLPARSLPHPLDSPAVSFLGPWAGSPCSPGPSRLHLPGRHLLVPPVPAGRRRGRAVTELNSRCFSGQAAQAAQGLPGVLLSATGDGGGGVGGELGCEPTCPLMPQRVRPRPISRDLRRQLSGRGPRKYRLGAMGTGMGVPTPLLTPRAPDAFPQGILAHKTQTGTPASAKEPTAVSGPPPQMLLRPLSRTAAAAVFPTRLLGTHTGGAGIPPPPNKVSEAETGAREVFQSPTGATPPPPQVDDWLCPEREVKGGAGALNPAAGPASGRSCDWAGAAAVHGAPPPAVGGHPAVLGLGLGPGLLALRLPGVLGRGLQMLQALRGALRTPQMSGLRVHPPLRGHRRRQSAGFPLCSMSTWAVQQELGRTVRAMPRSTSAPGPTPCGPGWTPPSALLSKTHTLQESVPDGKRNGAQDAHRTLISEPPKSRTEPWGRPQGAASDPGASFLCREHGLVRGGRCRLSSHRPAALGRCAGGEAEGRQQEGGTSRGSLEVLPPK